MRWCSPRRMPEARAEQNEPLRDRASSSLPSFAATRFGGVNLAMTIANVGGIALYLWAASLAWVIPSERAAGIDTVTGEPFIWAMGAVPVFGIYLVVNLIWLVVSLVRKRWRNTWTSYALVWAAWVVAVIIDFAHH